MSTTKIDRFKTKDCYGCPFIALPVEPECRSCVDRSDCAVMAYKTLCAVETGQLVTPYIEAKSVPFLKSSIVLALPDSFVSRRKNADKREISRMKKRIGCSAAMLESKIALDSDFDELLGNFGTEESSTNAAQPQSASTNRQPQKPRDSRLLCAWRELAGSLWPRWLTRLRPIPAA